jgi:hypothetical protein
MPLDMPIPILCAKPYAHLANEERGVKVPGGLRQPAWPSAIGFW